MVIKKDISVNGTKKPDVRRTLHPSLISDLVTFPVLIPGISMWLGSVHPSKVNGFLQVLWFLPHHKTTKHQHLLLQVLWFLPHHKTTKHQHLCLENMSLSAINFPFNQNKFFDKVTFKSQPHMDRQETRKTKTNKKHRAEDLYRHFQIQYFFLSHFIFNILSFHQARSNVVLILCKMMSFYSLTEPRHNKTNKVTVRPVKTQISLGIRPVWSGSSLCTQWVVKDPSFLHADSEDSDQTGWMPRLIWVFAGCSHFVGFVMSWL